MVYIVEITIISAFHGYMICPTFLFFSFFYDFTLSPLGVPPAVRWILKEYYNCNKKTDFFFIFKKSIKISIFSENVNNFKVKKLA